MPSTMTAAAVEESPAGLVTIMHPPEGAKLPALKEVFVFGATAAGSRLTINGSTIAVHAKGGYLAMLPLSPGENILIADAHLPSGGSARVERRFSVAAPFAVLPLSPLTILKDSISPSDDMLLSPGDIVRVSFQGTPVGTAEFAIQGLEKHVPMIETGSPPQGLYEGSYIIPRDARVRRADIAVTLKKKSVKREVVKAKLTVESDSIPRMGVITEDTVAARTTMGGGYDIFLYKGMMVQLTGKVGTQWRVKFSAAQSGWVKESAIQELPRGTTPASSMVTNMKVMHDKDSTLISVPLAEVLPFRVEQSLEPMSLVVTLFGGTNKTDFIRYDPVDPLVQLVRWRQITPDTCQLVIEPRFKKWWGFDVRYEGSTLIIEIREPWLPDNLRGMSIAVDAGHGGSEKGAAGPHGTWEKNANLEIATRLVNTLEEAGARPFLIRTSDADLPLYERPRLAWKNRARLFISVHANSSGYNENPIWNNGSSVYFYHPQSQALAEAIHAGYRKHVSMLPDRGLFYGDFAVCRMTQMPAVLTEQAYMIVPEQEAMLFDPAFQQRFANAIVNGIKTFLKK